MSEAKNLWAREYIPMLQSDSTTEAFEFIEIETDFEFLVNSNSYLRVTRDRSKLVGAVHPNRPGD
jgi:hypothetical protein